MVNWCKVRGCVLEGRRDWRPMIGDTRAPPAQKGRLGLEQIVTTSQFLKGRGGRGSRRSVWL